MVFSPMPGVPVLPEGLRGGPQRGPQRFRGGRLLRASAARPGRVPASVRIAPNRIVTIVHCQQDKLFALQSCRFFFWYRLQYTEFLLRARCVPKEPSEWDGFLFGTRRPPRVACPASGANKKVCNVFNQFCRHEVDLAHGTWEVGVKSDEE